MKHGACSHPEADGSRPTNTLAHDNARGIVVWRHREASNVGEGTSSVVREHVEAAANILTNSALDPYGKIPEFKVSAVRVEKASAEATV